MRLLPIAAFCVGISLLGACTNPNPPLTLYDRFVLVALTDDAGNPLDRLYRWPDPLRVEYHGPDRFRQDVVQHAEYLASVAGLPVRIVPTGGNMIVKIADLSELQPDADRMSLQNNRLAGTRYSCFGSNAEGSELEHPEYVIGIADVLSDADIRSCIVQEMTQVLGLPGDLDGRTDTNFASYGGAPKLTEYDRQLLAMLYDERLRDLMPRRAVLAVLPFIVADMEAEQEAANR